MTDPIYPKILLIFYTHFYDYILNDLYLFFWKQEPEFSIESLQSQTYTGETKCLDIVLL